MPSYGELFGATDLQLMPCSAASPGDGPVIASDRIMHAQFSIGGAVLMASDFPRVWAKGKKRSA